MSNNRIIWCIREPRTGSSWFVRALEHNLKRSRIFFDLDVPEVFTSSNVYLLPHSEEKKHQIYNYFKNRTQTDSDFNKILSTHEFCSMEFLQNYENPMVFRNCRRNKTKQFISLFIAGRTNRYNIYVKSKLSSLMRLDPMIVPLEYVREFIQRMKEADNIWKMYCNNYDNEIVYYEDLIEGWKGDLLPFNLKMNFDGGRPGETTVKLPYIHEEVIINYEEVDRIINEELV